MSDGWAPPADLLTDAADLASGYRDRGWDVTVLEPSAIATLEAEAGAGFAIDVQSSSYESVERAFDAGAVAVEGAEVYARRDGEDVLAIAVELDASSGTALVIPLSYRPADATAVLKRAGDAGELVVHVRHADAADRWVGFSHDDPSLFEP